MASVHLPTLRLIKLSFSAKGATGKKISSLQQIDMVLKNEKYPM
jgi:hypothetical protein